MGTVTKLSGEQLRLPGIEERARGSIYPSDFLWFWDEYPNKKAKLDALRAWQQTVDLRPDVEQIIAAIAKQKSSDAWTQGFIPHPATWLRGGRWDDE